MFAVAHLTRPASPEPVRDQPATPGTTGPLPLHHGARVRAAAHRALSLYPGPVGKLLQRELLAYDDFGRAFGPESLTAQVVQQVMTTPLPGSQP